MFYSEHYLPKRIPRLNIARGQCDGAPTDQKLHRMLLLLHTLQICPRKQASFQCILPTWMFCNAACTDKLLRPALSPAVMTCHTCCIPLNDEVSHPMTCILGGPRSHEHVGWICCMQIAITLRNNLTFELYFKGGTNSPENGSFGSARLHCLLQPQHACCHSCIALNSEKALQKIWISTASCS